MPQERRHTSSLRKLAAIMFTDIVGYTALMGSDEKKAFELLHKNRNIQKPIIKKYRGKWLKEMGDGILASFHTASDAVRCTGEIQQAVIKEEIALRIGIHEGEVVFEGGEVLGNGVNVASRLEELANNGSLHPVQQAFIDEEALQCGYCTPGMILTADALLHKNPTPSEVAIMEEMDGNVCHCGSYKRIVQAIKSAASVLKEDR